MRRLIQGLANEQADVEVFMATSPPNPPAQGANQTTTAANLSWPSGINPDTLLVARIPVGGVPFYSEAALDTSTGPAWRYIVVRATRAGAGVNGQNLATLRQGWMYFAPQNETLLYDEDGNLTQDARWHYRWDGENRLKQMEEMTRTDGPARQRLTFTYDSQSRRVRKVVESFDIQASSFSLVQDLRFLYDDWNLIAEFKMNPLQPSSLSLQTSFAWGYDLSGTEQGAGGVGGLLFVKTHTPSSISNLPSSALQAPTYDGNGNITAYLDIATGQVTSRHEYDAFGNELSVDSLLVSGRLDSAVSAPAIRFSTKYNDAETTLCYYGYRYLSAELGRWLNEDPLEEKASFNLVAILSSDVVNQIDILGRIALGAGVELLEGLFDTDANCVADTNSYYECLSCCHSEEMDETIWDTVGFGADLVESAMLGAVGILDAVASYCIWETKNSNRRKAREGCEKACKKAFPTPADPLP